jgi:hypothetical protein
MEKKGGDREKQTKRNPLKPTGYFLNPNNPIIDNRK